MKSRAKRFVSQYENIHMVIQFKEKLLKLTRLDFKP
jgi:hypothetical protein